MKTEIQNIIKIKIAITLNKLLENSKNYSEPITDKEFAGNSYNKIALNADLRKATVSDIFNGKSNANAFTLICIVHAMGYKIADFAVIFDDINDAEIRKFKSVDKFKL